MNVQIFNVLQKASANFRSVNGKQFLANISAITSTVSAYGGTLTESQFNYESDPRLPTAQQRWVVEGDRQSINQSISGSYNSATISMSPATINGAVVSGSRIINVNNIRYGYVSDSNVVLEVLNESKLTFDKWVFTATNLIAIAQIINGATSNQVFSVTYGSCTTSTQAITYNINQSGNLILEAFNGANWVSIDSDAISAGSGSHTFSFDPGDLVLNQGMRVTLQIGSQYYPIASSTFQCTGGSGSGSGTSGDCNMYAYFDGDGWNNSLKLLNWGATCTQGYVLQVSTSPDFTNESLYVIDTTTESTEISIHPANGTYYARVRNIAGQTRFSPTLTFVVS